ncbi:hypothetical protein KO498_16025 [Lentibacter algarum]|uniref:NUDIX hydrolase n=1 Tax=Lentibacter algarum TaxID=576131 RepID=UPI001C093B9F|nr:NUDIX domain-containing protein [Lentibacter algarum]MBU2983314.1 hypothetical protein [Lentibacter algarum]
MTYPKPTLAADIAFITVHNAKLHCLLMNRDDATQVGGDWALPGKFVHEDVSLEDTAQAVALEKAGLRDVYLEQLATYGALDRDPRQRVISITYLALVPHSRIQAAIAANPALALAEVTTRWSGETGGQAQATSPEHGALALAFDHADILGDVVKRLRGKLDYSPVGLELLPKLFTLRDVQEIHEAILGQKLAKPAFRRKLLDRNLIKPTGQKEQASAFRPAELYSKTK